MRFQETVLVKYELKENRIKIHEQKLWHRLWFGSCKYTTTSPWLDLTWQLIHSSEKIMGWINHTICCRPHKLWHQYSTVRIIMPSVELVLTCRHLNSDMFSLSTFYCSLSLRYWHLCSYCCALDCYFVVLCYTVFHHIAHKTHDSPTQKHMFDSCFLKIICLVTGIVPLWFAHCHEMLYINFCNNLYCHTIVISAGLMQVNFQVS